MPKITHYSLGENVGSWISPDCCDTTKPRCQATPSIPSEHDNRAEFCVNQSRTVLHRRAFVATGAPANRLMQLMLQKSVCD